MTRRDPSKKLHRSLRPGLVVLAVLAALLAFLLWAPAAAAEEKAYDDAASPTTVDRGQAVLGKHLFRSFCSSCHGLAAKGDGSIAEMMTVEPADLTVLAAENDGEFPFQRTVAVIDGREPVKGHGSAEMPAWGDAFAEISETGEEVDAKVARLAHYIWSIQEEPED